MFQFEKDIDALYGNLDEMLPEISRADIADADTQLIEPVREGGS